MSLPLAPALRVEPSRNGHKEFLDPSVVERFDGYGMDVWVYAGVHSYLRNLNVPHRESGEKIVQFARTEVKHFEAALNQGVAKIVGVSDDLALVAQSRESNPGGVSTLLGREPDDSAAG